MRNRIKKVKRNIVGSSDSHRAECCKARRENELSNKNIKKQVKLYVYIFDEKTYIQEREREFYEELGFDIHEEIL